MPFFEPQFAARTAHVNPSVIREILKVVAQPDIISFAGGMPAQDLFPYEELQAAANEAFSSRDLALKALQYGPSEGYTPLRQLIAEELTREGIDLEGNQILITTGSQQAIDMYAKIFLDPGDEVLVANPSFLGALQSFASYEAKFSTVPMDEEGIKIEPLTRALERRKPKFIYVNPTFQNPTGISMSEARKAELYAVARLHGVPILEDDPYGELYFGEQRPTTLKSIDHDCGVTLLRTYSKVLAPGLRVGYAVVPTEVMTRMLPIKQSHDLHTSAFNQVMIHAYTRSAAYGPHLVRLRVEYAKRRDLMLDALKRHFPDYCSWTKPEGGLFIWVTLPAGMAAAPLLEDAVANQKVAFIPGQAFYATGGGENTFRLNFSNASADQIEEGIKRLGALLRAALPAAEPSSVG